jgi:hypothetical protein
VVLAPTAEAKTGINFTRAKVGVTSADVVLKGDIAVDLII